ncbi:MAG: hypothetical protein M0R51_11400 [Clostridia bacterium]|nr:hypothetical protein [Clostridia bacterium]
MSCEKEYDSPFIQGTPWSILRVLEFILEDPTRLQATVEKELKFYSNMR